MNMKLPLYIPPNLPTIPLYIFATAPVLAIILGVFFIIYVGISGVIMYHWSSYGMKSPGIIFARLLYLAVSVGLFSISLLALTYY